MKIEEYLDEYEWKNITPYLFFCLNNCGSSIDYNISVSLYTDTLNKGMLFGGNVAIINADGIVLNNNFRYDLKLIRTKNDKKDYLLTNDGFIILAKLKK